MGGRLCLGKGDLGCDDQRFMNDRLVPCPEIAGASGYVFSEGRHTMRYVYRIERDALMTDMIQTICQL